MLEFLLVAPLPGNIEDAEHLSEQLAVFGGFLEIAAAVQCPATMNLAGQRHARWAVG